jgi:hypothetical protein
MEVIRQDHDSINRKRPLLPGHAKRLSKRTDVIDKGRRAVLQCEREEKGSAFKAIAAVSDHAGILSRTVRRALTHRAHASTAAEEIPRPQPA